MRLGRFLLFSAALMACFAQSPHAPNPEAQRAAMKKLDFLVGNWSGNVRIQRGTGEPLELNQNEQVQYKMDGLVLLIEGTGRSKTDGKAVFQALAIVSYDEAAGGYHMRAFNDGRYLETDLKLAGNGKGFAWGFTFGQMQTSYVMALTDKGDWTETGEMKLPNQPARHFMDLDVRRN